MQPNSPGGRGFGGGVTSLADVKPWEPTIGQAREAVLQFRVVGSNLPPHEVPPIARQFQTSQADVETISECCDQACRAGRLIDFGDWNQDVIKHGGDRGGPLYTKGAIGQPFRDPWMFRHTWEGGVALYMVCLMEIDNPSGECEIVELQPARISGERVLMIGDRVLLQPSRIRDADNYSKYACSAIPSMWRYFDGAEITNNGRLPENAAASNVLDPTMTALLILSTRGIVRETVAASDKLQKARTKNGKEPILPYERVFSAPYVTAIAARRARGRSEPKGGTHASPIGHLRMGHVRTHASGRKSFVRDALVNLSDEAKKAWNTGTRTHYAVKP